MTLGNMRQNGPRSVLASCACGRETSVNVDSLPDFVEVPAVRQRVRCSACGARPIDVRPDWREAHKSDAVSSRPERIRVALTGRLTGRIAEAPGRSGTGELT